VNLTISCSLLASGLWHTTDIHAGLSVHLDLYTVLANFEEMT